MPARWPGLEWILATLAVGVFMRAMKLKSRLGLSLVLLGTSLAGADVISGLVERAENGDVAAQLELATVYAAGEGVAKDPAAAVKWTFRSAEQGNAMAQFMLGQRHLTGDGVTRNVEAAVKWFSRAGEQGNQEAQMALGKIYLAGKGVKRNSSEAVRWFLMSAEQGNPAAQCQMGRMHMAGAGVSLDHVEAYKWCSLAAAQGDESARKIAALLAMRLTPEELEFGQQLARDYEDLKKAEKTEELPPDVPQVLPTQLPEEPE